MLTHAEIHKKIDLIIQGITSRENQAVFTSRGKRHYMDNWDGSKGLRCSACMNTIEIPANRPC